MSALRFALSLLAPPRCGICSQPCSAEAPACPRCAAAIAGARPATVALPGVGPVHAAATHDGVARGLVSLLKFAGRTALAEVAAEAIARALPADVEAGCIAAAPPARLRLRARGFDPAALIAAALAARLDLPLASCLIRLDHGRQVGRSRAERLSDPPRIRASCPQPRPLLVDDVLTTGATLRACGAALRAAGSEPVGAAVFARALGAGCAAA